MEVKEFHDHEGSMNTNLWLDVSLYKQHLSLEGSCAWCFANVNHCWRNSIPWGMENQCASSKSRISRFNSAVCLLMWQKKQMATYPRIARSTSQELISLASRNLHTFWMSFLDQNMLRDSSIKTGIFSTTSKKDRLLKGIGQSCNCNIFQGRRSAWIFGCSAYQYKEEGPQC